MRLLIALLLLLTACGTFPQGQWQPNAMQPLIDYSNKPYWQTEQQPQQQTQNCFVREMRDIYGQVYYQTQCH